MWLLQYEEGFYGNTAVEESLLYSTRALAVAGLPGLMDGRSQYGSDWRNGLNGFGKEDATNYLGLEHFVETMDEDGGGDLLTNKRIDSRDTITVSLRRMRVDPSESRPERESKKFRVGVEKREPRTAGAK